MARDTQPITKQSRREGYALHPKAHKIMMKRPGLPGQRGQDRQRRQSQFATQLREKQKVKRLYGILERQFSKIMAEASKSRGKSGEILLQLLEQRLDNVIYRAGFANSRRSARQLVSHGHFNVGDKRVTIPSYRVSPGEKIFLRPRSMTNNYFSDKDYFSAIQSPEVSWLSVNKKKFEISVTGVPKRDEAEANINEQLIVEYYSR